MVHLNIDLPEHFLEEEVRDGYSVSSKMKEVWAVELDLLNEFMKVCKRHNIQYFAAGGTMLGAVRHRGMIPWDDDIDIMMFRSEYTRLCKVASQEFRDPYFFQTEETDSGSYRGHAQLRNSETTGILRSEVKQRRQYNQGIFIDIFPLDNIPDNEVCRKKHLQNSNNLIGLYNKYNWHSYPYVFDSTRNPIRLLGGFIKHILISGKNTKVLCAKYYEEFLSYIQKYNDEDNTEFLVMTPFFTEKWIHSRSSLEGIIEMPFEMLKIPVPVGYEQILAHIYGEWKKFQIGSSVHGGVFFDTEHSYREYI